MIPTEYTAAKLRQLNTYMLAEPRRVNMDFWAAITDPTQYDNMDADRDFDLEESGTALLDQRPPCGVIVRCQAGNLCIMEGQIKPSEHFNGIEIYDIGYSDALEMGEEILQLSQDEASKLFFMISWGHDERGWPEDFEQKLKACQPGTLEYVQVIVDRNEHYIATGE